jgi:hypothetical protein
MTTVYSGGHQQVVKLQWLPRGTVKMQDDA